VISDNREILVTVVMRKKLVDFLRAREIPIVSMQDPAKGCVAVGKAVIEFDRLEALEWLSAVPNDNDNACDLSL